ncbi:MAG TPA: hypothetical protein DCZ75_12890 [Geobacter sp.]|nr:hypothetical protein [Geobacter sp.]
MQGDKERQEISVMGRLLRLEALVFLMGVASLIYGLYAGSLWNMAVGLAVLAAAALLAWKCRQR